MGIEKFKRKIIAPVGSLTNLEVSSVARVGQFWTLPGNAQWRGIATIASGGTTITVSHATLAVTSLTPPLLALGTTTVASHRDIVLSVNSIVTNKSFSVVADKATVDSQQVVYMIPS